MHLILLLGLGSFFTIVLSILFITVKAASLAGMVPLF